VGAWLVKSDPETYGLDDLERDGQTVWDGVTNPVAVRHLRAVHKGDSVLVYHTGDEKAVVGLGSAASDGRPDPKNSKLAVFDLAFVRRLPQPVTLAAIKADPRFGDFELVRVSRLSVMPVPADLWSRILKMAGAT
jgi:predicted RNA-binding protein with PUA-like domain